MKQNPSRLKFKKYHKLNLSYFKNVETRLFFPLIGKFALQSSEQGKLLYKQIESGRKSLKRSIKKKGLLYIRVFPFLSVTKKSLGVRQGKGKGNPSHWVAPIKKGQIIYEIFGLNANFSKLALKKAGTKLPFRTKVIKLIF